MFTNRDKVWNSFVTSELSEAQSDLQTIEKLLNKFGHMGNDSYILDENPSEYSLMNAHA